MTGTPLNNNIRELFNLLNFLDPTEFRWVFGIYFYWPFHCVYPALSSAPKRDGPGKAWWLRQYYCCSATVFDLIANAP
jgi:hypothetical protein